MTIIDMTGIPDDDEEIKEAIDTVVNATIKIDMPSVNNNQAYGRLMLYLPTIYRALKELLERRNK